MASEFSLVWGHELTEAAPAATQWVWQGYLAAGNVTLLTAPPKLGKTTLLAVLLHHLRQGGTLAGLPVRRGRAVVVTEESPAHWQARGQRLTLAEQVCFCCRPFRTKPTAAQWQQLLEHLLALHEAHRFDLVVIDPLAAVLPGRDENQAAAMLQALLPLQRLTGRGLSVLLLHHPSKDGGAPGLTARGSGALPAYADVLLELQRDSRDHPRRRKLVGLSRHAETPDLRLLELNEEGTDYGCVGEAQAEEVPAGWRTIELVLEEARGTMSRAQVLEQWPPDYPRPSDTGLWRLLEDAIRAGRVCRSGSGRRRDPYRYWLPGRDSSFPDTVYNRLILENERLVRKLQEQIEMLTLRREREP